MDHNTTHIPTTAEEAEQLRALFAAHPAAGPLFARLEHDVQARFSGIRRKIGKTQVSYFNKYGFLWLWPPYARHKGWPQDYLGVSFGYGERLVHPRIVEAVEPYPHRWTHHVLVQSLSDLDEQLMEWVALSYAFSASKR